MKIKNLPYLLIIPLLFTCCKEEDTSIEELLSDSVQRDKIIDHIINDYSLMMIFLDRSMSNDQAKSMILGHRLMMSMMMNNTEMMVDIINAKRFE